jgi:transposase
MSVYMGIDWSAKKHDIVILNEAGATIARETIPHQASGFQQLNELRQLLAVPAADCLVGLERAHNLLVDFLWSQGYEQVFVIPATVVKSSRGRYGSAGTRSDQRDAHLLADILRTDRLRLQPWRPDSLLTRQIRAKVSLIHHLTKSVRRATERLRAILLRYYPAALELFSGLQAQISLAFLLEYSTPQAMAALSYEAFVAFAKGRRYPGRSLPKQYARLQRPQPQASPDTVQLYREETRLLAQQCLDLVQTNRALKKEVHQLFRQHPDCGIFASLPGAGQLLAPSLLAKFGDDRERFPLPSSLQALAGTCPVTDASGKRRVVKFRRSCDLEFRQIAQQWARASLGKSVWAQAYWDRVRPRSHQDNDAYRRLANRWLAIAWKLWQTRQPYDEAFHLQQRLLRCKPRE